MINFKPFANNVLIEVPMIDEKTKSGIIKAKSQIEEEKSQANKFLKVVAIGDTVTNINVGDMVLLNTGKHPVVTIEDKDYLIIYVGVILGKLI